MKKLFIISNESFYNHEGDFFCDNLDMKSTPEGLDKKFEVNIIARKSKQIRTHNVNLQNIIICRNILSFLFNIIKSFKEKNSKYLIFSISPYTTLAAIIIKLFGKNSFVFLRSDGYGEYKAILGFLGPFIYHPMFYLVSKISFLISCRKYILKRKKGEVVEPSQLTEKWFQNIKQPNLSEINLLYVGRIKVEKGIFSLIEMFNETMEDINLVIVGAEKNLKKITKKKNINIYEIEKDENKLINFYDNSNIFILPSFTEGHPMTLLEALSRQRPVVIFNEIKHVVGEKKGIFNCSRDAESLKKTINHIIKNYQSIQNEMKSNSLPTKDDFLKNITILIENN
jgi:glycosyltransferase involved in cell wall biosynthesis